MTIWIGLQGKLYFQVKAHNVEEGFRQTTRRWMDNHYYSQIIVNIIILYICLILLVYSLFQHRLYLKSEYIFDALLY